MDAVSGSSPRQRRSLLEDDSLAEIGGRDESSGGDVCGTCDHPRSQHGDSGCKSCGCEEFVE